MASEMSGDSAATGALLSALRREIVSNGLVGASLAVAMSGGPDSTALAHGLVALRDELGLTLHAAHLDHGLRPGASAADADFVRGLADGLGMPLTIERVDTPAFRAERKLSTEDAARRLRYGFLARVAEERGADCVALGHTLDDQAETVLMHVLRGSGLAGLRGMRALSRMDVEGGRAVTLFRPMLSVAKSATLAYCEENGLAARLDESNLSTEFTRNRIRLELMPQLERYNPSVRDALSRLASASAVDMDFIMGEVERAADGVLTLEGDSATLDKRGFLGLHPAIGRHLLMRAVRSLRGSGADLEAAHVSDMFRLMSGPSGKGGDLPGGLRFQTVGGYAHIAPSDADDCPLPEGVGAPFRIRVPGVTDLGGWRITACVEAAGHGGFPVAAKGGMAFIERFDADVVGERLSVRRRVAGDRFQPLGMDGEKKLKRFMIDAGVPRSWRDRVPVVESGGRIAWVVGWRMADWAKVRGDSRRVLRVGFEVRG